MTTLGYVFIPPLLYYLYRVRVRLLTPHPGVKEHTDHIQITKSALQRVSYDGINMLDAIPREPTGQGYAVIGGSGFVGGYIVRLLLTRGEWNIRIIDAIPPTFISSSVVPIPGSELVTFCKVDVTNRNSVRTALTTPFPSTNRPPSVIFHTAAVIRFWERSSYAYPISHAVNVLGTKHIVEVLSTLPSNENNPTILIYTSTAGIGVPRPRFMRLGLDWASKPWDKVVVSDYDDPLPEYARPPSNYARSKRTAECVVTEANGRNGLRTGIIRPGVTIIGPNDRLLTTILTLPRIPVWGDHSSQTNVCVWDVAAAHLNYEHALMCNVEECSGDAFFISVKDGKAWSMENTTRAVQCLASKPIKFIRIDPLVVFFLCHLIETFLFVRYYVLLPFYLILSPGTRPNPDPRWLGEGVYMQPMLLNVHNVDVVVDDSRARKVIGYRPQWTTEQCIKYTVDEFEAGRSEGGGGMRLKSH